MVDYGNPQFPQGNTPVPVPQNHRDNRSFFGRLLFSSPEQKKVKNVIKRQVAISKRRLFQDSKKQRKMINDQFNQYEREFKSQRGGKLAQERIYSKLNVTTGKEKEVLKKIKKQRQVQLRGVKTKYRKQLRESRESISAMIKQQKKDSETQWDLAA